MPCRSTPLVQGEYYHIFNRGVAYQNIFRNKRDYDRFLLSLHYYQFNSIPIRLSKFLQIPLKERSEIFCNIINSDEKIIDLIAYCLMPNHFHLLIKQNTGNGISRFLRITINSYAKYFNTKYKRAGSLFQGMFKAVRIETEEQLLHVSRYIHLNPLVSHIVEEKNLLAYPWSSLSEYITNKAYVCNPEPILTHFSKKQSYRQFVLDQADYGKELESIKHLIID